MIATKTNLSSTALAQHQRSYGCGRLSVKFAQGQTRIDTLYQEGCAKIRMPASGSDGLQAVMINSSGGITGGDWLEWSFKLADQTALTVTTQACERIYAASNDVGETDISITVGANAKLAWLPQETILFDKSAYHRRLNIHLEEGAELLMVEPVVFGRKAMGETVNSAMFKDSWRIWRGGQLLHAEEVLFEGAVSEQLNQRAVANGQIAMASLLMIADHAESVISQAREIIGDAGGASFWNGKLLARVIAEDSYMLRKKLVPLVRLMNRNENLPKVWAL